MITYLKQPQLNRPRMLAAWPGMGYVASKTVSFLIEALNGERFAFIRPEEYFSPSSVVVENNQVRIPPLPESNFYFWKNPLSGSDLILFLGDAQPSTELQIKVAREVVGLAKQMGVFQLFTFAAAPSAIQHKDTPGIWRVSNTAQLQDGLLEDGIRLLKIGQISGLNGLLLGVAARADLPGVCLLAEIPYYTVNLENPRASYVLLDYLNKNFFLSLDLSPLREEIKKFDREIVQMGKKAQETMAGFMEQEEEYGSMGDLSLGEESGEEIEEERPELPEPARRNIEELFRAVKRDPSRAPLLKKELDRWGVYSQYEDRFLDLFRKGKDRKDN